MNVICMFLIVLTELETWASWLHAKARDTTASHTLTLSSGMCGHISNYQRVYWLLHTHDDIHSFQFSCIIGCIEQWRSVTDAITYPNRLKYLGNEQLITEGHWVNFDILFWESYWSANLKSHRIQPLVISCWNEFICWFKLQKRTQLATTYAGRTSNDSGTRAGIFWSFILMSRSSIEDVLSIIWP